MGRGEWRDSRRGRRRSSMRRGGRVRRVGGKMEEKEERWRRGRSFNKCWKQRSVSGVKENYSRTLRMFLFPSGKMTRSSIHPVGETSLSSSAK